MIDSGSLLSPLVRLRNKINHALYLLQNIHQLNETAKITNKMTSPFPSPLVSPAQFHAAVSSPTTTRRIVPVAAGRRAVHASAYHAQHIPNSVYVSPSPTSPSPVTWVLILTNTASSTWTSSEIPSRHTPRCSPRRHASRPA